MFAALGYMPEERVVVATAKRNDVFYVAEAIPESIDHLVYRDRIATGEKRLISKTDLVMIVREMWSEPCTGVKRVEFMRAKRTDRTAGELWFARAGMDEELRKALVEANVPCMETTGVFDQVLLYDDETAIRAAAYGSHGWILTLDQAEEYRRQAQVKARIKQFKVWHAVYVDPRGRKYPVVYVEGWGAQLRYGDPDLCSASEYVVVYDATTGIVQRIALTNVHVHGVSCEAGPLKSIRVGKRLPRALIRK